MPQVYTPLAFAAGLRAVGPALTGRIAATLGAGLTRAEKYAVEDFTSRGIGRAIYGAKPGGVLRQRAISRTSVKVSGTRYTGGLRAQGLAALQEGGGRIKKHRIPKTGTAAQSFQGTNAYGGRMVVAKVVNHPGAAVQRYPFLQAALAKAQIPQALDRYVSQFLQQKLG